MPAQADHRLGRDDLRATGSAGSRRPGADVTSTPAAGRELAAAYRTAPPAVMLSDPQDGLRCERPERPADLDAFWDDTLAQLDSLPLRTLLRPRHSPDPAIVLRHLSLTSLDSWRIHGYCASWTDDTPRPLIVHAHGYAGPETTPVWPWISRGAHVMGIDIRGYGASGDAASWSRHGYVLTGADNPLTAVLRGAVCDLLRGVQAGKELLGGHAARVVIHGRSFAGGLATMAEGLRPQADRLVLQVPSLACHAARARLATRGSGSELRLLLERDPVRGRRAMASLAYFDAATFAADVRVPTLLGLGERDDTVPAETVRRLYAALDAPKRLIALPVSHSTSPLEERWERFERHWLDWAFDDDPSLERGSWKDAA